MTSILSYLNFKCCCCEPEQNNPTQSDNYFGANAIAKTMIKRARSHNTTASALIGGMPASHTTMRGVGTINATHRIQPLSETQATPIVHLNPAQLPEHKRNKKQTKSFSPVLPTIPEDKRLITTLATDTRFAACSETTPVIFERIYKDVQELTNGIGLRGYKNSTRINRDLIHAFATLQQALESPETELKLIKEALKSHLITQNRSISKVLKQLKELFQTILSAHSHKNLLATLQNDFDAMLLPAQLRLGQ